MQILLWLDINQIDVTVKATIAFVCVCVRKRERERERVFKLKNNNLLGLYSKEAQDALFNLNNSL